MQFLLGSLEILTLRKCPFRELLGTPPPCSEKAQPQAKAIAGTPVHSPS